MQLPPVIPIDAADGILTAIVDVLRSIVTVLVNGFRELFDTLSTSPVACPQQGGV